MSGKRKTILLLLGLVVLASALTIPLLRQRAELYQLRAENKSLAGRVGDLNRELARAQTNRTSSSPEPAGLSRQQMNELMRLRAEVTALRQQTNAPAQARTARAPIMTEIPISTRPVAPSQGPTSPATAEISQGADLPLTNAGVAASVEQGSVIQETAPTNAGPAQVATPQPLP